VESAAGADPDLVMVANDIGVGGEDLIAGEQLQTEPGGA